MMGTSNDDESLENTFVSGSDDSCGAPNEIRTIPNLDMSESESESENNVSSQSIDSVTNNSENQIKRKNSSLHQDDREEKRTFVEIRQFDLGGAYDVNIPKYLNNVQEANKIILASPPFKEKVPFLTQIPETRRNLLNGISEKATVDESFIEMLVSENLSGKFQDWYFLTEDCEKPDYSEINDVRTLLQSFGVKFTRLDQLSIADSDLGQFDSFCEQWPAEEMFRLLCTVFERQINDRCDDSTKTQLVRYFIAFILDRNVYQYTELNPNYCPSVFQEIILSKLLNGDTNKCIEIYFEMTQNVMKRKFFLIYRLVKVLPSLRKPIIEYLFNNDTTKAVDQFNKLFDAKNLQDLLYFILFILGSNVVPFGSNDSPVLRYFRNCIDDVSTDVFDEVELSVIRGYLDTFARVHN